MLEAPENAEQALAIFCGALKMGSAEVQPAVLASNEAQWNPWAAQLIRDVRALSLFDDGLALLEGYGSAVRLLIGGYDEFVRLDVTGIPTPFWTQFDEHIHTKTHVQAAGQFRREALGGGRRAVHCNFCTQKTTCCTLCINAVWHTWKASFGTRVMYQQSVCVV